MGQGRRRRAVRGLQPGRPCLLGEAAKRDHGLDFGAVLFFHEMSLDPADPHWAGRDFWHFSIGHVTPIIYSLMAERGYFPLRDLMKFRKFDGHLQGHPSRHDTPGIERTSLRTPSPGQTNSG